MKKQDLETAGKQKALNYMVNSMWDYAQKYKLEFPFLMQKKRKKKPLKP